VYPYTENLDFLTYFRNIEHTPIPLANSNAFGSIEQLNVSSSKTYSYFEMTINATTETYIRMYYCNESYATGNVLTNPNCVNFYTIANSSAVNHTHNASVVNQSSHHVMPLGLNSTTGMIGTVKVTNTSRFMARGRNGYEIQFWAVENESRIGAMRTTSNGGVTWTNQTYTVDAHLHQFDSDDILSAYVCANTTETGNCSTIIQDTLDLAGLPPSAPILTSPINQTYKTSEQIWINYTSAISPNEYAISYYNISLMNSDMTVNSTINGNNSVNLTYYWNASGTADGEYYIRVTAYDVNNLTSIGYSDIFLLDPTAPITNITAFNEDGTSYSFLNASSSKNITVNLQCDSCNMTVYCVDTANTCTPTTIFTANFSITAGGRQYIRYRSNDTAGNLETAKNKAFIVPAYIFAGNQTVYNTHIDLLNTTNWATIYNVTIATSGNFTLDLGSKGTQDMLWNETKNGIITNTYTICDLTPSAYFELAVDDAGEERHTTASNGCWTYTKTRSYTGTHTFHLYYDPTTVSGGGGGGSTQATTSTTTTTISNETAIVLTVVNKSFIVSPRRLNALDNNPIKAIIERDCTTYTVQNLKDKGIYIALLGSGELDYFTAELANNYLDPFEKTTLTVCGLYQNNTGTHLGELYVTSGNESEKVEVVVQRMGVSVENIMDFDYIKSELDKDWAVPYLGYARGYLVVSGFISMFLVMGWVNSIRSKNSAAKSYAERSIRFR
jgi:hypothetical protein